MNGKTALERAFELADQARSLKEIRETLKREGYDQSQLYGTTVTVQLGQRILAAKRTSATQEEVGNTADKITRSQKKKAR